MCVALPRALNNVKEPTAAYRVTEKSAPGFRDVFRRDAVSWVPQAASLHVHRHTYDLGITQSSLRLTLVPRAYNNAQRQVSPQSAVTVSV